MPLLHFVFIKYQGPFGPPGPLGPPGPTGVSVSDLHAGIFIAVLASGSLW